MRLTKRGAVSQRDINNLLEYSDDNQTGKNDVYYKLQYYEDLEEQDRLKILPCNIGDTVYVIAPRYVECDKKYNCKDYDPEEYLITWCQNYCPNGYKGIGVVATKIEAIYITEGEIDLSTKLGRYHIENVYLTKEKAEVMLKRIEDSYE